MKYIVTIDFTNIEDAAAKNTTIHPVIFSTMELAADFITKQLMPQKVEEILDGEDATLYEAIKVDNEKYCVSLPDYGLFWNYEIFGLEEN